MTTAEIEALANEEAMVIGSADINLKTRLRLKVIPEYEMAVGECAWRRVFTSIAFAAGDREKDLPSNFGKMLDGPIFYNAANEKYPMAYMGEDVSAILLAEGSTESGSPSGFYMLRPASAPKSLRKIRLDRATDVALTMQYGYLSEIQFADLTTSVDLDEYIPKKFQWGLVEGLKIEVLTSRLSIDDPRVLAAGTAYQKAVDNAQELREPAMRTGHKRIKTGPL